MNIKVSVVVPVYNMEKYLEECINSILNQKLKEIEVIIVDDGSSDNSGVLADSLSVNDTRIKVIHQNNQGLGPARNTGILNASGKYIGFVDSDDYILPSMYEDLYRHAVETGADIVQGCHRDVENGDTLVIKRHPLADSTFTHHREIMSIRKNLFGHTLKDKKVEAFPMTVWSGIYRKDFLLDNKLLFEEIQSEDTIFNLQAYRCAKIISFTCGADYCYRVDNHPSIMNSFSENKVNRYLDFIQRLYDIARMEENECVERVKKNSIDTARLYISNVEKSNLSICEKIKQIKRYTKNPLVKELWNDCKISCLPMQQKIFHMLIRCDMNILVLLLSKSRSILKRFRARYTGAAPHR